MKFTYGRNTVNDNNHNRYVLTSGANTPIKSHIEPSHYDVNIEPVVIKPGEKVIVCINTQDLSLIMEIRDKLREKLGDENYVLIAGEVSLAKMTVDDV